MTAGPLLEATDLRKSFAPHDGGGIAAGSAVPTHPRRVVDNVSLCLRAGETFAIVGESGCGKTTLARLLVRLIEPDAGSIRFQGQDWLAARGAALRKLRAQLQLVFQDPYSSLDPRMRVGEIVSEPLRIHHPNCPRRQREQQALDSLRAVGLDESAALRFPHEFSGGQRQRISIARALVLRPALVIADEPISALDVSIGAQILELLMQLQRQFSLTCLLISHSLPVVAQMANRVAVMRAGVFVEEGAVSKVLNEPQHPYTRELLAAVPSLDTGH
jgi:ABC-type microcin C transport system duplicated ATPase subunit YejF